MMLFFKKHDVVIYIFFIIITVMKVIIVFKWKISQIIFILNTLFTVVDSYKVYLLYSTVTMLRLREGEVGKQYGNHTLILNSF